MIEKLYWLGFSNFQGIGPVRFSNLLKHFGSAKSAWEAAQTQLREVLGEKMTGEFDQFRNKFSIDDYAKKLEEKNVWFVTLKDEEYPKLLAQIKNPPFLLYGKGDIMGLGADAGPAARSSRPTSSKKSSVSPADFCGRSTGRPPFASPAIFNTIAVVGTRRITQYGREVTNLLTSELVLNGFTIVSGLALGVDAVAHQSAIENKGKTIAVLGCGVDCCSPEENTSLYNSIINSPRARLDSAKRGEAGNGGCVISEYPLGAPPTKGSFPQRNRIIAGLSVAVLVTEGAEDSGALITANFALKFNRKVFAVPGPITSSLSKGPYKLISKGAKLVTSGKDILKELKIQNAKLKITVQNSKFENATREEREILNLLQNEQLHFDEIVRRTKFNSSKLSSILSMMEIKGMVKSLEGGMFSV